MNWQIILQQIFHNYLSFETKTSKICEILPILGWVVFINYTICGTLFTNIFVGLIFDLDFPSLVGLSFAEI
jgi:hypothetical protein